MSQVCLDPDVWLGSAGPDKSVPVQALVTGIGNFSKAGGMVDIVANVEFTHFFELEPSYYDFQVPERDLFCVGRIANKVKFFVNVEILIE